MRFKVLYHYNQVNSIQHIDKSKNVIFFKLKIGGGVTANWWGG